MENVCRQRPGVFQVSRAKLEWLGQGPHTVEGEVFQRLCQRTLGWQPKPCCLLPVSALRLGCDQGSPIKTEYHIAVMSLHIEIAKCLFYDTLSNLVERLDRSVLSQFS